MRKEAERLAEFQSPSLRGSGRFEATTDEVVRFQLQFQSPSLRGSGRFGGRPDRPAGRPGFNPLHCGAVVASTAPRRTAGGQGGVSIPFIAGQWSLLGEVPRRRGAWGGFNPLHCGAVVASGKEDHMVEVILFVSIPFIAGQWSLLWVVVSSL